MSEDSSNRSVAILGFHKVGKLPPVGWDSWFYIPEVTFIGYLQYLEENGWQVIDLATFLSGLDSPHSLPEKAALLTFDDGYQSILDVALPCLLRFGYPAVLFVPTDFVGGRNTFDAGVEKEEAMCDWEDLRELEHCGVSVQSHGASHRRFSQLDPGVQEQELIQSKAVLGDQLGKPVKVFCYPYGDSGAEPGVIERVLQQAGYQAACLYGGGPNRVPITNPYRLTRLALGPDSDLSVALESYNFKGVA